MKTNFFKRTGIKSLLALVLVSSFAFYSCSEDDTTSSEIEEAEAAEAIESSLTVESNGMVRTVEVTITYATEENLFTEDPYLVCGQLYTESFNENYTSTNYSYNYAVVRDATLNCDAEGNRQNFESNSNFSGTYNTPRMSSDDTIESMFTVTGLAPTDTNSIFNGSYIRIGTQVSKTRNNTFNSTLTYDLNDINVNRTTYEIQSGSASVNFVGTSSTGNQYTYNGTITFNGGGSATLVLNGNTYNFTL